MIMCSVLISDCVCRRPSWKPKTQPNGSSAVVWLSFWFSTRFTGKKLGHSSGIYLYRIFFYFWKRLLLWHFRPKSSEWVKTLYFFFRSRKKKYKGLKRVSEWSVIFLLGEKKNAAVFFSPEKRLHFTHSFVSNFCIFFPAPEKKNTLFLLIHSILDENITKVIFSRNKKKTATRLDPWEIERSGYSRKKFMYSFSFYFSFSFLFFFFCLFFFFLFFFFWSLFFFFIIM